MASRAVAIILAGLVAAFVAVPLVAVLNRAGGFATLGAGDWAAVRFTIWQAFLSAFFSCLLAIPAARALARRRFWGRDTMVTLLGAPFILPVIVAILGLLAVFGREGLVSQGLVAVGLPRLHIYGLHGILVAHVFFNLPLAIRFLLQGWQSIPTERFRLAAQLNLSSSTILRVLELPMLRKSLPGAFLVIFVICLSSFAVALTLGGGPRATTVELAIYQAFRFDFDLAKAATLSILHLMYVGLSAFVLLKIADNLSQDVGLGRQAERWDGQGFLLRQQDRAVLALVFLFLALPVLSVLWSGIPHFADLPFSVWTAAGNSLVVAISSAALCMIFAVPLATLHIGQTLALLGFALSPLVLGTGLFLIIQPFANPFEWALPVTCVVNALMSLPFAVRALAPAYVKAEADYGKLADNLALQGVARWRWLILPQLRKPAGFAAGLAAALSMGDLGVIILFADPQHATLPLQMYRLMGAYQMETAGAAAALLLALSLGLFWLFDKGGRHGAAS